MKLKVLFLLMFTMYLVGAFNMWYFIQKDLSDGSINLFTVQTQECKKK